MIVSSPLLEYSQTKKKKFQIKSLASDDEIKKACNEIGVRLPEEIPEEIVYVIVMYCRPIIGPLPKDLANIINQNVTTWPLSKKYITDQKCIILGHHLVKNTTVKKMDLTQNIFGFRGTKIIAKALRIHNNLTELAIGRNNITDKGAKAIAESLKTNPCLEKLVLEKSYIGDAGAAAIAEALKKNITLTELNLAGSTYANTVIGHQGALLLAEGLKINHTLKRVSLNDNKIGDKGATALANCWKSNATLTEFLLCNNEIGDVGATMIGESLKTNSTLKYLNLSKNVIGDSGGSAIGNSIKQNAMITDIHLNNNKISKKCKITLKLIAEKHHTFRYFGEHIMYVNNVEARRLNPAC